MRLARRIQRTALLTAGLLIAVTAFSQEGHPLTGTWSGDWGTSATDRTRMTLVMTWDGFQLNGILNPGPDSVELTSIRLDPTNWTVRIDLPANIFGRAGSPVIAQGVLEDLGSVHRTITGTWQEATMRGDFRLVRD